ncbi:LamG domain-containing protein [Pseudobacteroides cellulosolvens]|uniref:LamG domain protein jellyroll fold domain protein n=1 Tax=Pseudobacteroides cellulosolvens ATCC 35603 = DSM 2933 TaxID=398512 RepID=A0A0L6JPH5_9FIRM|nr:LamG domain-containing protein [Pseudobacteroides cellulosolvens]KNY27615.1 LamG domain protein jellyroll fold domain protein [Pseudobacteroides cellulosolvens ATCC 35603 = DSM 2933]
MFNKFFKRALCTFTSLAVCGTIIVSSQIPVSARGSLIARWSFDSSLSVLADSSGNGYNLSANTTVPVVNDAIKKTAFKGPNSPYVLSVENTSSEFTTGTFSITAWVKFEQDPANNQWGQAKILDYCCIGSDIYEGYSLYLSKGGYLAYSTSDSKGTKWTTIKAPNPMSAYDWHHVAVTYGSSSIKLYVDGVMVNSMTYKDGYKKPAGKLHIGSQLRKNGEVYCPYTGLLDEVSYYHEMLTDNEIKRDYEAYKTRCVVSDDSTIATVPYSGGYYAYSMIKTNTARLYNYGVLEMVTTTRKACPESRLVVSSLNYAEILDAAGNVIYKSARKSYVVSTSGMSERTDTYYENVPADIVSKAVYVRAY